jgi:hypothetical protein
MNSTWSKQKSINFLQYGAKLIEYKFSYVIMSLRNHPREIQQAQNSAMSKVALLFSKNRFKKG